MKVLFELIKDTANWRCPWRPRYSGRFLV